MFRIDNYSIVFRNRPNMIDLQYNTFKRRTISSVLILESALMYTFYLITYAPGWNYDAGVVLDNSDFNVLIGVIGQYAFSQL